MHLTPKEIDKLMLLSLGAIAARRKEKGLKLNYPEAVHQFGSFGRSSRRKNPGTGDDRFHKSIDQK